MNNFYLRSAAPVMVATLCFFTAIAGCQARDAEHQADEATSVQIPESESAGVVLPASASGTGARAGPAHRGMAGRVHEPSAASR